MVAAAPIMLNPGFAVLCNTKYLRGRPLVCITNGMRNTDDYIRDSGDSSTKEHARRRRRHASRRSGNNGSLQAELRAWVDVLDSLVTAVEETAWAARDLADGARTAFDRGQE